MYCTWNRYGLEESRRRGGVRYRGFPFENVTCNVSHYCLNLLYAEKNRMDGMNGEVYDRCGHVLRNTHQIPCACEIKRTMDGGNPISVHSIHIFWRTLEIGGRSDQTGVSGSNNMSEDQQFLQRMVDEVNARDPAVVRKVARMIHDEIHPGEAEYNEPAVNVKVRGRPRGRRTTKREASAWEFSMKGRGPARGRSSSSGTRKTSSSSGRDGATMGDRNSDIYAYIHSDKLPPFILPFVHGYLDVMADGNCGFRVLADYIFGDQELWRLARAIIMNEVGNNRPLYEHIFFDGIDAALARIHWEGAACTEEHWMTVADDLFPIATFYNAAIIVYGFGNGMNFGMSSCTVLPLRARSSARRPDRELVIAHLGTRHMHFIRLDVTNEASIPRISMFWFAHHEPTVDGWHTLYTSRIAAWERLTTVP